MTDQTIRARPAAGRLAPARLDPAHLVAEGSQGASDRGTHRSGVQEGDDAHVVDPTSAVHRQLEPLSMGVAGGLQDVEGEPIGLGSSSQIGAHVVA